MLFKPATIAALGLLALGTSALAQDQTPAGDPVVARIDDAEIHLSEVEAAARTLPEQYQQMPLPMIYQPLLDRVIDSRLLAQEAERRELDQAPEAQPALERARAQVLSELLVQQRIEEALTEDALQARFEDMKAGEDFAREEVHARHILLESEEEAKAVIEQLQGGADFTAVAQEKSTGPSAESGGDLGYFTREQMVPEFAEVAFSQEPGTISPEPVQTQFGWHVIEVLDKRTVEPTFEELEPQLRQEIAREVVNSLVQDLRAEADIERFDMDGSPLEEQAPAGGAPGEAQPGGGQSGGGEAGGQSGAQ